MTRRTFSYVTAIAALLLSSCRTVGPEYQPKTVRQLQVPDAWHEPAPPTGTIDLATWWQSLGDEQLSTLIDRALAANHDLRTARLRLQQARSQRNIARAGRLPSVDATASVDRRNDGDPSASLGIDASWELPLFGRTARNVEAAEADLEATEADLDGTQVSLTAELALNYIDLRALQAQLSVTRAQLASQETTLGLVRDRRAAGLVSELDVVLARTNVEQTRSQIAPLETSIAQATHRIAILIGVQPGALHAELDKSRSIPVVPAGIDAGIPADILRQRPDLRAAERRFAAETARVGAAIAERYPRVNVSAGLVLTGVLTGGTSIAGELARSLGASAFANIFDGGRLREQVNIQTAAQEAALVAYERAVLTALEDVENALVALRNHKERRTALTAAVANARTSVELSRDRYTAGLTDFLTVLDAERTLRSAEQNLTSNQGDIATAVVQLFKALGGGWSEDARS